MLNSDSISFVGVRTASFDEMCDFVQNVLGYELGREEAGFRAYRTSTGQRFEIFAPDFPGKDHFVTGPVVGFEVKDFEAVTEWLRANDVEVFGGVVESASGSKWAHFRGPDGNIYEFVSHPDL